MKSSKDSIVFVVGPTAVGKTQFSLDLARELNAEIVSCDAMQVYKEINIASAKPTPKELSQIKHHALNVVSVTEDFNVVQYNKIALEAILDIQKRGKTPLIVGGSGMYVSVLLDGIFEGSSRDENLRQELEAEIVAKGSELLHKRLEQLDPQAAMKIHSNDAKRIVRALEVVISKGKPISKLQKERQGLWGKDSIKILGLSRPRAELYKRVEDRIDQMFDGGLVDEIQTILKLPLSSTAKTLIGVPEVSGYVQKEYDLDRAKYLMKLHTRHYVKRQLTWFRRDKRIEWIEVE